MAYEFSRIEKKWQNYWLENKTYKAVTGDKTRKKFYPLIEFPYPSGDGLHVGHPRPYTAMDIVARKRRMQGENVLFPIGFDAFGLPTENYAIKNHIHPREVTKRNIERFSKQLQMLGYSFDWDRMVDTTDPNYYKWTQWIFLQMYKHGLAYKASMPVNWCTSCKCVLANEEVVEGVCERCGSPVIRKEKSQWMLRITAYAQRLIDDLDDVDYIERVKIQQRNWIGRSTGAEVDFKATTGDIIKVFTTRCDTLFGATYMVLSPEHALVRQWLETGAITNPDEVKKYQAEAAAKSDLERTELNKDKTGVRTMGVDAVNPVTGETIPIFISDYVLASYGTGAIMAVPGHDQRDWEFAKEFDLPIIEVVKGGDVTKEAWISKDESAIMVNSGFLDGLSVKDAIPTMTKWLEEKGLGRSKVNYKLRDWVFSRQRYWGEPIPLVYCEKCGWQPIDESELPLLLPDVDSYEPTDNGESPLSKMTEWVNTTCPKCGGPAQRETDTMPQWAGSCWYFLRYIDPDNDKAFAGEEALDYWSPVDWYNGGMEHTTLHLLYSRFWHKFLYDIGVVPTKEPYAKRTSHGMILGLNPHNYANLSDDERSRLLSEYGSEAEVRKYLAHKYGEMADHPIVKMSKSLGNVVNPDSVVKEYGADTLRLYIMFLGDFEKAAPWNPSAVKGCKRFLDRIWALAEKRIEGDEGYSAANEKELHRCIKKVSEDIENMKFNTAIAAMMTLVNQFYEHAPSRGDIKTLLALLSPFAPHMAEELWEIQGFEGIASMSAWPEYDEAKTLDDEKEIAVQVNGKLRGTVVVPAGCEDSVAVEAAMADAKVKKFTDGNVIVKTIVVKDKLVNIIVKPSK
ncbi:MAG: leucine--tRNA ligase [Oscillospiraceae bacterium]|jgi:leucyl-tRNA synthetase|nr:leucine--tRNA ligase [Oscillospiraceae bacterium]